MGMSDAPSYEEAMMTARAIISGLKNLEEAENSQYMHENLNKIASLLHKKPEELDIQMMLLIQREFMKAEEHVMSTPPFVHLMDAVTWAISHKADDLEKRKAARDMHNVTLEAGPASSKENPIQMNMNNQFHRYSSNIKVEANEHSYAPSAQSATPSRSPSVSQQQALELAAKSLIQRRGVQNQSGGSGEAPKYEKVTPSRYKDA